MVPMQELSMRVGEQRTLNRCMAMSGEIRELLQLVWGATGISWAEARDLARYLPVHWAVTPAIITTTTRKFPAQTLNADVEKSQS